MIKNKQTIFIIDTECTGYQVDENDINNFPKKNFVWGKWTILGPKMGHSHNSGSAVRIFLNLAQ